MDLLLSQRRVLKGKITRIQTIVDKCDVEPINLVTIDLYLSRLSQISKDCDLLNIQMSALCDDAEYASHEEVFSEFECRIEKLSTVLTEHKPKPELTSNSSTNINKRMAEVKLPKLELPSFSGKVQEWVSFHDLFSASVHNNKTLSGAQKLQYLKASLKGDASLLLQSLQVTDANYTEAWQILTGRYENKRELVYAQLKRLIEQPILQVESATALQKLVDITTECVRSVRVLGKPIDDQDAMLTYIVMDKLDPESRRLWTLSLKNDDVPNFKEFVSFMDSRVRSLAAAGTAKASSSTQPKNTGRMVHHGTVASACYLCSGDHGIYKCPVFEAASPIERRELVKKHALCFNCLRKGHNSFKCRGGNCRKCHQKHNTMLHIDQHSSKIAEAEAPQGKVAVSTLFSSHHKFKMQVLLSTALVKVRDGYGGQQVCRALLDSCSQVSIISEECMQRLGLRRQHTQVPILGLGSAGVGTSHGCVQLECSSCTSRATFSVSALILPKVTGILPYATFDTSTWSHIQGLNLADPTFNVPGKVDILIGADVYAELMCGGRQASTNGAPVALESVLGWLLSGPVQVESSQANVISHHVRCDAEESLQKFWELEELPPQKLLTKEEQSCEDHFQATHTRSEDGRYVLQLPFRDIGTTIGASRENAVLRLKQMERRLTTQPERYNQYKDFMQEYLDMGHMELIPANEIDKPTNCTYYMPHHAVLKEASTTTKLRVVFDASAKTRSNISLNDLLMVGPKLQDDLISLLMRFRRHEVAFTADIAKMYRQIHIHPMHLDFQRIVWRSSPEMPIQDYRLTTVTYGTASAPYQATKCLQQLAEDEVHDFPEAAKVVQEDFYMDDLMSGAPKSDKALELQAQLILLLQRGGFELRKWSSNDPAILHALPPEFCETNTPLRIDTDESIKTLGMYWHPAADYFSFHVTKLPCIANITKRELLSDAAKIFDPLGWLAPTTIKAKMLFQELWRLSVAWDEPLPNPISEEWIQYRSELPLIEAIKIKRCITGNEGQAFQLHGFCDASEKAYAAAVYLRSMDSTGSFHANLVAAKTRVAPIKQVSLPRLELCGALLLAKLMELIQESMHLQFEEIHAWTDSTIVLGWIASQPTHWKTFVANRVSEIQDILPPGQWHHVKSEDNPADCASRGITPAMLQEHPLWWHGPSWLCEAVVPFSPQENLSNSMDLPEEKKSKILVAKICIDVDSWLLDKFSSWTKLRRVTAYCKRFIHNCRSAKELRKSGFLTSEELKQAEVHWIKQVQASEFAAEINCCRRDLPLPTKSRLLSLNPFLDEAGMLRVGGRLRHAKIAVDKKHPIMLPRHSHLTKIIVDHYHRVNLHAGTQLLLSTLQQCFWILSARDMVRQHVRKCPVCFRHRADTAQQMMADLPAARINPSRPFSRCGVDYAGPFMLRVLKGRGHKMFKGYVAVFICFATRAMHIELVSDLTSDAFIAALKRFISRRGKCEKMFSDCGTNFVGANKELRELLKLVTAKQHNSKVAEYLANEGIKWHFNPPAAPHFGGLWEAGVKSVKYHLKRVLGNATLNFEEMVTILAQIEACLNSRPISAMSADPNDLTALTPGHFLIGDALTAIPEPDYTDLPMNRLSRWQLTQQMFQHFWKRWASEYLSRLQQRPKWWTTQKDIGVGDLVLIKDERQPPLKWHLGRVILVHPGLDKKTRVVTLKTAEGELKRPIAKLCPMPID